ncbi:hypothetical protein GDO81_010575 [Engystomops pustulosus]|uniref:Dual specificity protein phosphatase n=1 Tax=Engystomops pustulosus TaxID=76066 RepID=A0AAV7C125_ENGPU|nr:hypothetical protein GDO81_010575 [Engystomops pustulosus]
MVNMEISAMDCRTLRALLADRAQQCLVLDCRSFFSFSSSHIMGSSNVRFSTIVKRRAKGSMGLEHIIPNEEQRCRLIAGLYEAVVLLDDRTCELEPLRKDSTMMLAVSALCRDPRGSRIFFLKGTYYYCHSSLQNVLLVSLPTPCPGRSSNPCLVFSPPGGYEAFSAECPEFCNKCSPPVGLSLPLSASSVPDSADSNCTPCGTPLYDQGGPVEILPFLYLGSAYHASRKDMLDTLGITALINVSANCPNHFEGHYQYKSIPVEDSHKADISSWFNEAIDFIDSIKNKGGRVFVHCQAGISRSATICLAYLMRTNRVKLDEAFEFVKQRRSIISPNFSFMGQLLQFESQVLAPSCSAEVGSPSISVLDRGTSTTTVFNFPVSIPVHPAANSLSYLKSPITTSPSC